VFLVEIVGAIVVAIELGKKLRGLRGSPGEWWLAWF
jgi:hypothetical protein